VLLPLPHTLNKGLAAKPLPRLAFALQLALDHQLRGNARMVRSREPQRQVAAHAVPTRQDVHLRMLEHVAHVQVARHIRRGQQHGEDAGLRGIFRRGQIEQPFAYPIGGPAIFNRAGIISFLEILGHSGEKTTLYDSTASGRSRHSTRTQSYSCLFAASIV
jgi:hypothetical protein